MKQDFVILVFITLVPASWLVIGVLGVALRRERSKVGAPASRK